METGHVVLDISMFLDGFITGPNADVERGCTIGRRSHEQSNFERQHHHRV